MSKTVRSRAPLRLGFAGGGTDVAPYCDEFGGCVLNATIDLYAHCTITLNPSARSKCFHAADLGVTETLELGDLEPAEAKLQLHHAIHQRIIRDFHGGVDLPVSVTSWSDAPPGSGLGTSSTLVVAILSAYVELLSLPLGEYDIAHLAYEIERIDCGLAGGKQDQYAATFGGFNFMEFSSGDRVIVNPLRIRRHIELELEASLMLYFTGQSRESARIIEDQKRAAGDVRVASEAVQAMHEVKQVAYAMKESVLKGDIASFSRHLATSWEAKKRMAKSISSDSIEAIAARALECGGQAVKISGAGGGGFMMVFVDPAHRHQTEAGLRDMRGQFREFRFTHAGVETWTKL
ncbi:dehydrogenase [Massilia sp. TS11]|uniref:GHMP family kinase ATP-binding protein n=1 Tax=Massilia sp. TS11 TaxID=2908003 RepID=UPI001ED9D242|nr:dehydrogenase [Massilia sp. TS11]MCG2582827.1 dehydrogenase [Massilia sp. TS11]